MRKEKKEQAQFAQSIKSRLKGLLEGRFRIEKVAHIERENDEYAISTRHLTFQPKPEYN